LYRVYLFCKNQVGTGIGGLPVKLVAAKDNFGLFLPRGAVMGDLVSVKTLYFHQ
jgi:hypothetical protein